MTVHPVAVLALELALTPLGAALRTRRPGPGASITLQPALATSTTLRLTSPAFAEGGEIPARHCGIGIGEGRSPELRWSDVPEGAGELLLVMEDVDVPLARPVVHSATLLPAAGPDGSLDEGGLTADAPGLRHVTSRLGRAGYVPPRPLPGHGVHRYGFHLYALDARVPDAVLAQAGGLRALLPRLAGHVLAAGHLYGTRRG